MQPESSQFSPVRPTKLDKIKNFRIAVRSGLLVRPYAALLGESLKSDDIIVQVPLLSEERVYPNEQALIDLVATERVERRRALAYYTHACTMDITERIDDIITDTREPCR